MIFRDDDLPQGIIVEVLDNIHQEFLKRNKIHTITILASEIDNQQNFVKYVNETPNFDIALHGWIHDHYPIFTEEMVRTDLDKSMSAMERNFGKKPTKWYLPWNGWINDFGTSKVDWLRPIAKEYGLEIDIECNHIGTTLRDNLHPKVVYFHWWHKEDIANLPLLLDREA